MLSITIYVNTACTMQCLCKTLGRKWKYLDLPHAVGFTKLGIVTASEFSLSTFKKKAANQPGITHNSCCQCSQRENDVGTMKDYI